MNDIHQRSCRGCGESGHNIRSCVIDLDKQIIEEYSFENFIPIEFPSPRIETLLIRNKLNKLCQKYGLSITNITDNQKKERLHNIYICLGRQHRRNIINQLYLQQRQIHLYRPNYLPPELPVEQRRSRFLNHLSLFYLQNQDREPDRPSKKPSLQIIVNPSKFTQNTDVMECPICYDKCCNMLVTDCNHSYCQPCISTLINSVNKTTLPCPLCRENIKNVFVFSETSSDLMLHI